MEIHILGPLRVLRDGRELDLGRPKQRVLLAALVTAGGATVSVDRLVDELWGESPPPRAVASLHAYVSNLRRVLEPDRPSRSPAQVLATRPPGYALILPREHLDAARFQQEADEVQRHLQRRRFEHAYDLAGEALDRWRGDVLDDLGDEPVAVRERVRWNRMRVQTSEDRLHAAVELGLHATAIADLEQLLGEDPLRERAFGLLMRSLHLSGRSVEALDRYRAHRSMLQDELGIDPGAELQALEAAVLRQDPGLRPVAVPDPVSPVPSGSTTTADAEAAASPMAGPGAPDLVGRAAELAEGDRMLTDVCAGRPRWLTISGEPGIGKTRLAEALAAKASASGIDVAWGRCHEDDDAPPYWPWSQLLRSVMATDTEPIAELLPHDTHDAGVMDAGARRYRLHERVAELVTGGDRPRLLIVDDVQWADAASLQLVAFLAVQLRSGHLGVVLTMRDGVERPELSRTLATVDRHPGADRAELGPISVADVAELGRMVHGEPLTAEAATALHARSAGNAFFATELLRLSGDRDSPDAAPPAVIREVVERRIAPLGDDARAALDLGAIVGLSFDLGLLETASGMDVDRLFDALDVAVADRILIAAGDAAGTGFRFAHALVRDTLLADLAPLRRQRLHARVAEALRHRPRRDPARHAAELAHHLVSAVALVGVDAAREAAEQAARTAEARLAFDEAAGWWDTARELVDRAGGPEELVHELRVATGRARLSAGQRDEGRAVLTDAMDAAAARGDAVAQAMAGVTLGASGGAWYWVDPNESPAELVVRLERASEALGPTDHPLRVALLGTLALGVYYSDPDRAATLVREALAIARRLDDPFVLSGALLGAMAGEWGPDTADRHLALSEELLTLPAHTRSPVTDVAARLWRMTAHEARGELAEAEAELGMVAPVAEGSGLQILQTQVAIARIGHAWLGSGGLEAVEEALEDAAELHRRSGLYAAEATAVGNRSIVRLLQGRLDEVVDELPMLYGTGSYRSEFEAMAQLGGDDRAAAVALLSRPAPELPATWQWLLTKTLRAMLVVELHAPDLVDPLRTDLAPYTEVIAVAGTSMTSVGPVALHLGALHLLADDLGAAEGQLRVAATTCGELGIGIWGALARVHLGEAVLRSGRLAEAVGILEPAAADAERLGLHSAASRAVRRLTEARGATAS